MKARIILLVALVIMSAAVVQADATKDGSGGCEIVGKVCDDPYCSSKLGAGCTAFNATMQGTCNATLFGEDLKEGLGVATKCTDQNVTFSFYNTSQCTFEELAIWQIEWGRCLRLDGIGNNTSNGTKWIMVNGGVSALAKMSAIVALAGLTSIHM